MTSWIVARVGQNALVDVTGLIKCWFFSNDTEYMFNSNQFEIFITDHNREQMIQQVE